MLFIIIIIWVQDSCARGQRSVRGGHVISIQSQLDGIILVTGE